MNVNGSTDVNGSTGEIEIQWTCLRDDEPYTVPTRAHANDAGFDLCVSRDVVIEPGAFAAIPTNIAIALPDHVWALLVGRSSTFYKRGLLVNGGIIDPGYRGELLTLTFNLTPERIIAHEGDRMFQLIPIAHIGDISWKFLKRGKELPVSHRGAAGVGSTGGYITQTQDPR